MKNIHDSLGLVIYFHVPKIKELVNLKNCIDNKYSRLVLTVITMKYYGYSNNEIIKARLSKTSIAKHIKLWNSYRMRSVKDNRGGSQSKLESEMVDNLIYVIINNLL